MEGDDALRVQEQWWTDVSCSEDYLEGHGRKEVVSGVPVEIPCSYTYPTEDECREGAPGSGTLSHVKVSRVSEGKGRKSGKEREVFECVTRSQICCFG